MIDSTDISAINETLMSVNYEIRSANERLVYLNNRQEDILHIIEFERLGRRDLANMAVELRDIRRERRELKNEIQRLTPISDWMASNQNAVNRFSQAIGKMRSIEKSQNEAIYRMRAPGEDGTFGTIEHV